MERSKIEEFLERNTDVEFPHHESLSGEGARTVVCKLLGLFPASDATEFGPDCSWPVYVQARLSAVSPEFDGNAEDFNLNAVLSALGLSTDGQAYLIWDTPVGEPNDVDLMKLSDLADYWRDIYWSGYDNLFVVGEDFSWILSCCEGTFDYWLASKPSSH